MNGSMRQIPFHAVSRNDHHTTKESVLCSKKDRVAVHAGERGPLLFVYPRELPVESRIKKREL